MIDWVKLTGVVITCNPDKEFEGRANHLVSQFDVLIIVDNGSEPKILERVRAVKSAFPNRVELIENTQNLGVATAFNQGVKEAAARGFRFAVLFDHDSRIDDGFVDGLLRAYESIGNPEKVAVLGARYEDTGPAKDKTPFVIDPAHPLWLERDAVISSGSLISIPIWQKLGGLRDALFIDYVDDEYCLRARREGYRVLQTTHALFSHRIGNSTARRFLGKAVHPLNQPAFRWYYVARNFEYVSFHYGLREPKWALNRAFQLLKRAGKMLLFEEDRAAKIAAIVRGLKDGFRLRGAPLPIRKIGIALAAYRPNPGYLLEQLKSLQAQTFKDWICHVSFDSPLVEIRADSRFAPFFSDPRFRWSENPAQLGHLRNFEKTIQAVAAEKVDAIACCDQDDVWYPEKLEISVRELSALGPMGLVFCDMHLMNEAGEISRETAWQVERRGVDHCGTYDLLVRNVVPGTGMLMDAELARKFTRIPDRAIYHDHWYPLVASRIGKIRPITQPLYTYRIHSANVAGLSPYTGLLARKLEDKTPGGFLPKCRSVWARSEALAQAAEKEGLALSPLQKLSFLRAWDLGVSLAFYGAAHLLSDPSLARACAARAVGKLADFWQSSSDAV